MGTLLLIVLVTSPIWGLYVIAIMFPSKKKYLDGRGQVTNKRNKRGQR